MLFRPAHPDYAGPMSKQDVRESRAALILMAGAVLSVLVFGAVTLLTQAG